MVAAVDPGIPPDVLSPVFSFPFHLLRCVFDFVADLATKVL